jgi:hypothetical protein
MSFFSGFGGGGGGGGFPFGGADFGKFNIPIKTINLFVCIRGIYGSKWTRAR